MRWDCVHWAVGLVKFAVMGAFHTDLFVQCVAWIVVLNGILCHGSFAIEHRHADLFRWWDVVVNLFLGGFINLTSCFQPYTWYWSMFAAVSFIINQHLQLAVVHWTCVALPFAISLYYYDDGGGASALHAAA